LCTLQLEVARQRLLLPASKKRIILVVDDIFLPSMPDDAATLAVGIDAMRYGKDTNYGAHHMRVQRMQLVMQQDPAIQLRMLYGYCSLPRPISISADLFIRILVNDRVGAQLS
jgi:hypothetical protein